MRLDAQQHVRERVAVGDRAAAEAVEQRAAADLRRASRATSTSRQRVHPEDDVLPELDVHAADAEADQRPERRVAAATPTNVSTPRGDHRLHDHALHLGGAPELRRGDRGSPRRPRARRRRPAQPSTTPPTSVLWVIVAEESLSATGKPTRAAGARRVVARSSRAPAERAMPYASSSSRDLAGVEPAPAGRRGGARDHGPGALGRDAAERRGSPSGRLRHCAVPHGARERDRRGLRERVRREAPLAQRRQRRAARRACP